MIFRVSREINKAHIMSPVVLCIQSPVVLCSKEKEQEIGRFCQIDEATVDSVAIALPNRSSSLLACMATDAGSYWEMEDLELYKTELKKADGQTIVKFLSIFQEMITKGNYMKAYAKFVIHEKINELSNFSTIICPSFFQLDVYNADSTLQFLTAKIERLEGR